MSSSSTNLNPDGTEFPDPNDIPPPSEDQLTEEDLFRMRSLTINSKKGLVGGASETAEQSIISLADSTSNFDEHVGDDVELDYELEQAGDNAFNGAPELNPIAGPFHFAKKQDLSFVPNANTVTVLKWPTNLVVPPRNPVLSDSDDEWKQALLDSTVYLIGTAHFSKESQDDVSNTIRAVQPDFVMLELCPSRISIISMDEAMLLREARDLNSQKIIQTIKQNGAIQGILHILLLSMSAHVTRQLSMAPGGEFRAAYRAAVATDMCRVVLGDRPIQTTLQRALASLSIWQKLRFFVHVAFSHREKITAEEVERCKQRDLLEQLLAEMADDFPQLSQIFVEERDAYMTHALQTMVHRHAVEKRAQWLRGTTGQPFQPLTVVAVVGIGHTPGITAKWNTNIDFDPLMVVPPPSFGTKVFATSVRIVVYGSLGYLAYRSGRAVFNRVNAFIASRCIHNFRMSLVSQNVQLIGTQMAQQTAVQPAKELWFVDCQAMFQNYTNLRSFSKTNETQTTLGGLVFGRKARKQVVHVFFAYAEDLTESNLQFLESSLSADIELVGNVNIDGQSHLVGDVQFTLQLTTAMLEMHSISDFLDLNVMFNNEHVLMEGMSLVSRVAYEWSLRAGREQEDVKSAAERLSMASFRFSYLNAEHGLVIREHKKEAVVPKMLDKFSKGALPYKDILEFVAMQSLTRDTSNDTEDQKLVPTVKVTKDNKHFTRLVTVGDVVFPAFFGDSSLDLYKRGREAFNRRANNTMMVTVNGIRAGRGVTPTTSATYLPQGWVSLLHLQLPTKWTENEQRNYRIRLHKLFNLSSSKPCLRLSQSLPLHSDSARLTNKKLIREPHLAITNYQKIGQVTLVNGAYNYHHYMQDGIDDNGWGCAYRSFQTIWSWFILNGYTDKPVPNHRDIQQTLVNIGDKEQKFVGSRQWIGSTEISFVLNELLKLECRFIATNSGAEVVERVRELARHFETSGTPVMIGGNMLAHTILGVDFNEHTGESKFLILDPHYTGSEDIKTITSKGWCAWKPASFWSTDHFYNMVLPQPPSDAI